MSGSLAIKNLAGDDKFTVDNTDGSIVVAGSSTLSGTIAAGSTLTVVGAAALNGGITVDTNKFTVAGDGSGNTAIAGTLAVTSATGIDGDFDINTNKFTVASATGNTVVAGTLAVAGEASLNGGIKVDTDKFTVADGTGNTSIDGTLDVGGAVGIDGDFDIGTDKFTVASGTGNTVVGGTLAVAGNLTVNGTTTTVNSTTVTIDDPIFTLGGDTAPGSDDNKDRGIEFRWHDGSSAKLGFFGYDDSTSKFTFIPDATNNTEVFSGDAGDVAFASGSFAAITADAIRVGVTASNEIDTSAGNLILDSAGGTVEVDDILTVSGATTLSSTLAVTGEANFTGGIKSDTNKFTVAEDTGNTSIQGTLDVSDAATLSSSLAVTAGAALNGGITVDTNKFTVATNGNTAVAGTLAVTGEANFSGGIKSDTNKFTVADTSGNVATAGTLAVTGATTLSSTLDVTGATGIDGDFDINTNKFTVASATGNTVVAGTLDVTGATGIDGDFDVNTNKFTVASASGNTVIAGTLTVASNLDVNGGDTTIDVDSISLDAGGASNFTTSAGALTLSGAGGINIAGSASEIDVTTTGKIDINSGELDIDSTDTTSITMTANDGSEKVLAIDAANSGAGAAKISLGTTSGTAISIGHTTSETSVNDNLTVTGLTTATGNFSVGGAFAGAPFKVFASSGNTVIGGTLTVTDVLTSNGSNLKVKDSLIVLSSAEDANDNGFDVGLVGGLASDNYVGFIYDNSDSRFVLKTGLAEPDDWVGSTGSVNTVDYTGSANATLELGQIFLNDSAEDGGSGVATPLTTHATYYQTEGGGQTSTLAAGTEGQVKVLAMETHGGGNMVVTVTNPAWSGSTITLSAQGQACTLQYIDSKWYCIGNNGCTFG